MHYRDYATRGGGGGRRERQQTNSRKRTETDPILIDRYGQRDRLNIQERDNYFTGLPFHGGYALVSVKKNWDMDTKEWSTFYFQNRALS